MKHLKKNYKNQLALIPTINIFPREILVLVSSKKFIKIFYLSLVY